MPLNFTPDRKEYHLESLLYFSKITFDREHILKASSQDIQQKLNEYAAEGWRLASTDVEDFGEGMYFYLYFERDKQ
ncbi:DUF4177 domain-containing protein [Phaeodactylibacter luteus]|uniref:DUF4177 domain-containing protein n=1 Tax=Phaeodactylibacter luteus TaxID=1564516 RepID=A0A5C6RM03_9BACT|nr:DUF4177 domain-containing protein [Phaeodactylibacter luteus]